MSKARTTRKFASPGVLPSEITPPEAFYSRRDVLAAAVAAGAIGLTHRGSAHADAAPPPAAGALNYSRNPKYSVAEAPNSYDDITGYNNFYELGTDKSDPKANGATLKPRPWNVEIAGEAEVKGTFSIEDILKPHALEERIYRFRCVEGWSMVIPWVGFPLGGSHQALQAHVEGQVCGDDDAARSEAVAIRAHETSWTGLTSTACAWTKPCIRSPSWSWGSTASRFPRRTARRCG